MGQTGLSQLNPVADYVASPGQEPGLILFDNKSKNAIRYEWDFGDGTTSTTISPRHRYANNGTYDVRLTAVGLLSTNTLRLDIGVRNVTGSVSFYTTFDSPWSVDVYLNDRYVGAVAQSYTLGSPDCNTGLVLVARQPPGSYYYRAKQRVLVAPRSWSGVITIEAGGCVSIPFDK